MSLRAGEPAPQAKSSTPPVPVYERTQTAPLVTKNTIHEHDQLGSCSAMVSLRSQILRCDGLTMYHVSAFVSSRQDLVRPTPEDCRLEEELKELRLQLSDARSTYQTQIAESELLVAALHEHIVELEKQRDALKAWAEASHRFSWVIRLHCWTETTFVRLVEICRRR